MQPRKNNVTQSTKELYNAATRRIITQPTQEHNENRLHTRQSPSKIDQQEPLGFGQCKTQSPQARRTEAFWEASQLIWPMHGEEPATLSLKFLPISGSSPNVTYPCDLPTKSFRECSISSLLTT